MSKDLSTKILIADADPFRLAIYEQHLRNLGYTNISTVSFDEDSTDTNQYEGIIFIDIAVAAANCYAIIQNIKQHNPDNYIVLVTGKEKMCQAEEALKLGAFDLVIKGQYLFTTINEVLENIRLTQLQLEQNLNRSAILQTTLYLHPDGSIDADYW